MTGRVEFLSIITREMLRVDREARFVFGDNTARHGLGGQAREMRGEPNAIGVATKRRPGRNDADYFYDDSSADLEVLDADLDRVAAAMNEGRIIYISKLGLGTGRSEMPVRAPMLYRHLVSRLRLIARCDLPWAPGGLPRFDLVRMEPDPHDVLDDEGSPPALERAA